MEVDGMEVGQLSVFGAALVVCVGVVGLVGLVGVGVGQGWRA